jgi:hypothetical protein
VDCVLDGWGGSAFGLETSCLFALPGFPVALTILTLSGNQRASFLAQKAPRPSIMFNMVHDKDSSALAEVLHILINGIRVRDKSIPSGRHKKPKSPDQMFWTSSQK